MSTFHCVLCRTGRMGTRLSLNYENFEYIKAEVEKSKMFTQFDMRRFLRGTGNTKICASHAPEYFKLKYPNRTMVENRDFISSARRVVPTTLVAQPKVIVTQAVVPRIPTSGFYCFLCGGKRVGSRITLRNDDSLREDLANSGLSKDDVQFMFDRSQYSETRICASHAPNYFKVRFPGASLYYSVNNVATTSLDTSAAAQAEHEKRPDVPVDPATLASQSEDNGAPSNSAPKSRFYCAVCGREQTGFRLRLRNEEIVRREIEASGLMLKDDLQRLFDKCEYAKTVICAWHVPSYFKEKRPDVPIANTTLVIKQDNSLTLTPTLRLPMSVFHCALCKAWQTGPRIRVRNQESMRREIEESEMMLKDDLHRMFARCEHVRMSICASHVPSQVKVKCPSLSSCANHPVGNVAEIHEVVPDTLSLQPKHPLPLPLPIFDVKRELEEDEGDCSGENDCKPSTSDLIDTTTLMPSCMPKEEPEDVKPFDIVESQPTLFVKSETSTIAMTSDKGAGRKRSFSQMKTIRDPVRLISSNEASTSSFASDKSIAEKELQYIPIACARALMCPSSDTSAYYACLQHFQNRHEVYTGLPTPYYTGKETFFIKSDVELSMIVEDVLSPWNKVHEWTKNPVSEDIVLHKMLNLHKGGFVQRTIYWVTRNDTIVPNSNILVSYIVDGSVLAIRLASARQELRKSMLTTTSQSDLPPTYKKSMLTTTSQSDLPPKYKKSMLTTTSQSDLPPKYKNFPPNRPKNDPKMKYVGRLSSYGILINKEMTPLPSYKALFATHKRQLHDSDSLKLSNCGACVYCERVKRFKYLGKVTNSDTLIYMLNERCNLNNYMPEARLEIFLNDIVAEIDRNGFVYMCGSVCQLSVFTNMDKYKFLDLNSS